MIRSLLACTALAALAATAAPNSFAGGTIEIDEDRSVTFGAGLRSAFTRIQFLFSYAYCFRRLIDCQKQNRPPRALF